VANRLAQGLAPPKCRRVRYLPRYRTGMRDKQELNVNRFWMLIIPLLAMFATGCGRPAELRVSDAVVKLSPVDTNPSALYFTIYGGEREVQLLRVISNSVIRAEMHDSTGDPATGMLTMQPMQRLVVPAKGKIEFKRGGKHVMLWGVNLIARRLEKLEVEFVFSNGDRILVTAPIEKIGAAGEGHGNH
jgi:periplasmic copper chaperone A